MRLSAAYRTLRLLRQNGDVSVYDAWSLERGCRCVAKVLRSVKPDTHAEQVLDALPA